MLYYITGVLEHEDKNDGYSHSKVFQIAIPYLYPLFKLHKLSKEAIAARTIPPSRMVTGATNGPTYRLCQYTELILKDVVSKYCAPEMLKDSTSFIKFIEENRIMLEQSARYVCTLDVVALYPSIPKEQALLAVDHALSLAGIDDAKKTFVVSLIRFSFNNSVIHYRGNWYSSMKGIPTGGPDSGSIANIFVKWLFRTHLLLSPDVIRHNQAICRKRYLDDIFMAWKGTSRQFDLFVGALNSAGLPFGIQFTGSCAKKIEYLDTEVNISAGNLKTNLFVKPTDSPTYLNRRSYHSQHVFKSLPYSQFRRAVLVCSDPSDRAAAIEYMQDKYLKCGYKEEDLNQAKSLALALDRGVILGLNPPNGADQIRPHQDTGSQHSNTQPRNLTLTFVSVFSCYTEPLKKLVRGLLDDIKVLTNVDKIIFANKKNPNTASLLFCKSSFSNTVSITSVNQKCLAPNCKACCVLNLPKCITYESSKFKLDFNLNCKSDNVIYVARCKLCFNFKNDTQLYFGQTCNRFHVRLNGHRSCFKVDNFSYEKSALSQHIFSEHLLFFGEKLKNFDFGIIKQVAPRNLDRAEDSFIFSTRSDILGLNRYKVIN